MLGELPVTLRGPCDGVLTALGVKKSRIELALTSVDRAVGIVGVCTCLQARRVGKTVVKEACLLSLSGAAAGAELGPVRVLFKTRDKMPCSIE